MILRPILRQIPQPILNTLKRNIRPTIRINKEIFQITIDVRQFTLQEIRVKARPEYVIVEGKQEREMKNGYCIRQFVRKFKLPPGCNPERIKSSLSDNGILTIMATRQSTNFNVPCETTVPISYVGNVEDDASFVRVEDHSESDSKIETKSKDEGKKGKGKKGKKDEK